MNTNASKQKYRLHLQDVSWDGHAYKYHTYRWGQATHQYTFMYAARGIMCIRFWNAIVIQKLIEAVTKQYQATKKSFLEIIYALFVT